MASRRVRSDSCHGRVRPRDPRALTPTTRDCGGEIGVGPIREGVSECSMSASQCGYVGIGREASDETKIARWFARSMGVTGEILRAVAPSLPL